MENACHVITKLCCMMSQRAYRIATVCQSLPHKSHDIHVTSLRLRGSLFTKPSPRYGLHDTVLLLHNAATDCFCRVCLRGNSFSNSLPSNELTCHIMYTPEHMYVYVYILWSNFVVLVGQGKLVCGEGYLCLQM
jgi:hypothetical protein